MPAANRDFLALQWGILALLLLSFPVVCPCWSAESDLQEIPSLWVKDFEVRAWSGYKDNILLGNHNIVSSPFVAGGLDLTVFRLPVGDWEYLFTSSADYIRYLSASEVHQEATALAQGQIKRSFGEGWKSSLSAEYLYFNQVFDNSILGTELVALPVEGHTVTMRPGISKEIGRGYRLELELPATRQIFGEFIDGYWELGPKFVFGREFGRKSDLAFSYQFVDRWHDTREAREADGTAIPERKLEFYQHELTAAWRQYWDEARQWRTLTRLSLLRNEDNGHNYYGFWRPQVSEQLRYVAKTWELRTEAKLAYYKYDNERIGETNSPLREKTYLRLSVRGEKTLVKSLRVFGQYEYERAISNLDFDRYTVHVFSAGFNWEF
jgi:hypothetical protein